jgi:hypothetical protein
VEHEYCAAIEEFEAAHDLCKLAELRVKRARRAMVESYRRWWPYDVGLPRGLILRALMMNARRICKAKGRLKT